MKALKQREPLHVHFVRTAKQFERKLAIIDRGVPRRLTYRDALAASLLLAEKLERIDSPLVGVMLPSSAGAALVILALLMNGKTPVLLNYSTGVRSNVEYARKKCRFQTVVTAKGLLEALKAPALDGFVYLEDVLAGASVIDKGRAAMRARLSAERIVSWFPHLDLDANAAILFTTGSEQEPKAVPLTHRNILANLEALSQIYAFSPDDVMLASLPFFHVFGLTANLWLALHFGMTMVTYVNPTDYKTICAIIAEERPTYLVGTPSFLRGYVQHSQPGDFRSLRLIVTGADTCPDLLRRAYQEKHGLMIYEGYGTTETSPIITVNTPERNRSGSVGWLLPNLQMRIEHYDTGEQCKPGETGRILVKGESVFSGYLNDAEATAKSFRNAWYDTGDIGALDAEGFLWYAGRLRRSVKIGGEMVSLVRVEEMLQSLLPPDTRCCVVEIPEAVKGARIIAAVTRPIDERRVVRDMSKQLPPIALPKGFVLLENLPKMTNGKTDFKAVAEIVRHMRTSESCNWKRGGP